MNNSMMRLFLPVTLACGLSLSAMAQQTPPPALVEIDDVHHEMIAEQIWVPGTVISRVDADIASEVAGRVTWMADVGDWVEAGQPLIKLDDTRLQLTLAQDKTNIAKWQARVDLLSRKVTRFTSMAAQQNTSKNELDEVNAELEIARQELAQANVTADMTRYQIEQSQVKAPFTSLVVARIQSPGEYTSVGETLLHIVDPTAIEAQVRAPLSVIPFIESGIQVAVTDQRQHQNATIRALVPVGNAQSRMMELRVALAPGDFAIGSAVRVALPNSEAHKGITVPRDALVLRKSGAFIYQVSGDSEAHQVPVTTGIGVGERIEVFGDVLVESPVVIRGAERLQPGQKVRVNEAADTLTASRR